MTQVAGSFWLINLTLRTLIRYSLVVNHI